MSEDGSFEMFFIKKGETQCLQCEGQFPKNIVSHVCGNWENNEPQYDTYVTDSGFLVKRMIYLKNKRFVFLKYNSDGNLEVFSDFRIVRNHSVQWGQKKSGED